MHYHSLLNILLIFIIQFNCKSCAINCLQLRRLNYVSELKSHPKCVRNLIQDSFSIVWITYNELAF